MHPIVNTSPAERLYAVTIMANDLGAMQRGFEHLVTSGQPAVLDDTDKAAVFPGFTAPRR
ncbi:hypothetical protein [Streptomyces sp. NPDC047000]|uniref:hypothetical protein n=1 Tax=Streptomyces sp. NPDC047000 TaxID=3155474 RepID=UPI0033F8472E